jgi:hypothetical protein
MRQVNLFAYLRDCYIGQTFTLLLVIFDNRFAANPTYNILSRTTMERRRLAAGERQCFLRDVVALFMDLYRDVVDAAAILSRPHYPG